MTAPQLSVDTVNNSAPTASKITYHDENVKKENFDTTKHSRMNENNVLSAADERKLERQENIIDSNSKVNNYLRRARTMFVNDVEELMNIPKVLKNNDLKQVFNQLWNESTRKAGNLPSIQKKSF